MRRYLLFLLLPAFLCAASGAMAATGRILKVLPQLLDQQGRHSLSPSLYDRDAYQARLRAHPELCSGMRYAVQWKASVPRSTELRLRIELRGARELTGLVIEEPVKRGGGFGRWTYLPVSREQLEAAGPVSAWRVTLWSGEGLIAEETSFLW